MNEGMNELAQVTLGEKVREVWWSIVRVHTVWDYSFIYSCTRTRRTVLLGIFTSYHLLIYFYYAHLFIRDVNDGNCIFVSRYFG